MTADWPQLSVRLRIALVATAIVSVLLWIGGLFVVRDSGSSLRRSLDAQIAAVAQDVASQIEGGTAPNDVLLKPLAGPFPQPALQVRDAGGTLVASITDGVTLRLSGLRQPAPPAGSSHPLGATAVPPLPELTDDATWSVSRSALQVGDREYVVWAGSSYTALDSVLGPLALRLRIATVLLGAATAVLSYVLVGRALRPVELIRAEAESVNDSSLSRRVPEPRANDEVGRLARTLNTMLARLDEAQRRQRQFVSDASHELRNPIAIMRTSLEVANAHPDSTDWRRTGADLLEVTGRLEKLVDDLLLLARQHEMGESSNREEVDLDDLVRAEVRLRPTSPVVVATVHPARVNGSRRDLTRVVSNLLDNATRWAHGTIEVSLRSEGTSAVLSVEDDGPGVADHDRNRIFERFVRLDEGRARSGGGVGLGLAVVRETAEVHGGTAAVEHSGLGGARFVVTLPLAESSDGR